MPGSKRDGGGGGGSSEGRSGFRMGPGLGSDDVSGGGPSAAVAESEPRRSPISHTRSVRVSNAADRLGAIRVGLGRVVLPALSRAVSRAAAFALALGAFAVFVERDDIQADRTAASGQAISDTATSLVIPTGRSILMCRQDGRRPGTSPIPISWATEPRSGLSLMSSLKQRRYKDFKDARWR